MNHHVEWAVIQREWIADLLDALGMVERYASLKTTEVQVDEASPSGLALFVAGYGTVQ